MVSPPTASESSPWFVLPEADLSDGTSPEPTWCESRVHVERRSPPGGEHKIAAPDRAFEQQLVKRGEFRISRHRPKMLLRKPPFFPVSSRTAVQKR
jgi:hypothetical protein